MTARWVGGFALLALPFVLIFAAAVVIGGWLFAVAVFGAASALMVAVVGGVELMAGGKR